MPSSATHAIDGIRGIACIYNRSRMKTSYCYLIIVGVIYLVRGGVSHLASLTWSVVETRVG